MNLQRYQDFLAVLYTDPAMRAEFYAEPKRVGGEFGLSAEQITELSGAVFEELDYFSKTLFRKRYREVAKMLPLTSALAGDWFEGSFLEFASTFTPVSTNKHLEDSLAFLDYLLRQPDVAGVRDAVRFEKTRLLFFGRERRFAICRVGGRIAEMLKRGRRKPFIAVWLRSRGGVRHFLI